MFKWKKLGRVFNPTDINDRSWISEFAQAPATLIFDDYVRVYFSCRPKPSEDGQFVSYCAYIDLDKNNLFNIRKIASEPVLLLGNRGTFDEFGTYPISVIRHNNEVYAYYAGWTRCESVPFDTAIGFGKSKNDGKSFSKLGEGPVLSYSLDEPFVISGPKIRNYNGTFYLWYIAGQKWIISEGKPEPVYKIRMASSHDGINWVKVNRNLITDKLGKHEAQASPDVIYKNGKYHMFFCYRQGSDYRRNIERTYKIGYAYSIDMENWIRDDEKAGINISENGWDDEMVAYPHVFELNGKTYMFYLGNEVGRYGFGLAELDGDLV